MNKYRILTAALSSKATVDDFTFCRSSDLLRFVMPSRLFIQPEETAVARSGKQTFITELTAAGLSGTFTRFPFHPQLRTTNREA